MAIIERMPLVRCFKRDSTVNVLCIHVCTVMHIFNIVFCEHADSIFAHYSYVFVFIQYVFVNYSIRRMKLQTMSKL